MNTFCHKCGKKLEAGYEFCQSCGAKVSIAGGQTKTHQRTSLRREDLEKETWYRAIKVIYIIFIIIAVLIIGTVSWSSKPEKNLDGDKSSIACNNGKSYSPNRNDIYVYGADFSSSNDERARILCEYDTTNYYSSYYSGYITKNYTFIPVYEEQKYGSWIGYTLLACFITWLVFKLIKIAFFYIFIGEKPQIDIYQIKK